VLYFQLPLSKNLGRAVAWVAFVVALVAVCIPLGKEEEVGYDMLFSCQELYFEKSDVLLVYVL
jgi:hypothetical protein